MSDNPYNNAHYKRLFDDAVRTGIYDEIDANIKTCDRNANLARFAETRQQWLARALTYREIRSEAKLERAALLARADEDEA